MGFLTDPEQIHHFQVQLLVSTEPWDGFLIRTRQKIRVFQVVKVGKSAGRHGMRTLYVWTERK